MGLFGKKEARRQAFNKKMLLNDNSAFVVQEAYKALRTNIIFSLPGNTSRCIAVTSSNRSEGKSTNTINMAISFGQIGKRVLLIDCDMRLPTIAAKMDIKGYPGLSNVLVGDSSLTDAITTSEKYGIDVLPAGNIPPDPTGLLESQQMQILLAEFRKHYDYIFIDLPPITTVTDAAIFSKYVDGYLLVVKNNSSEYHGVSDMLNQLRLVEGKILGFVYVGAEFNGRNKYKYGNYGNKRQRIL